MVNIDHPLLYVHRRRKLPSGTTTGRRARGQRRRADTA